MEAVRPYIDAVLPHVEAAKEATLAGVEATRPYMEAAAGATEAAVHAAYRLRRHSAEDTSNGARGVERGVSPRSGVLADEGAANYAHRAAPALAEARKPAAGENALRRRYTDAAFGASTLSQPSLPRHQPASGHSGYGRR